MPRAMQSRSMPALQRSTWFSQLLYVGVSCIVTRGCTSSQAGTAFELWAEGLSTMK